MTHLHGFDALEWATAESARIVTREVEAEGRTNWTPEDTARAKAIRVELLCRKGRPCES